METKILELLAEICESDEVETDSELDLFESGVMDSLGFAEFLVALEEQFDIVISPSEVERDDINTPEKILELVMSRI